MVLTDLRLLRKAIYEQPAEDAPRLMLADELDALDPVRVTCPQCDEGWRPKKSITLVASPGMTSRCPQCVATPGTVIDPTREQWAELIRVQCELVRLTAGLNWSERYERWHDPKKGEYVAMTGGLEKTPGLRARESTLLAALDHCRPKCPMQCNKGRLYGSDWPNCTACDGTGRLPMTWHRGGASCRVSSLSDVWEPKPCPACTDNKGFRWGRVADCRTCKGTGNAEGWQPTPLGRELGALPLLERVECGDKRPFFYIDSPKFGWSREFGWSMEFGWSRDRPTYRDSPQEVLPPHIWDLLPAGNVYDTPEAARDALSRAVAESLSMSQTDGILQDRVGLGSRIHRGDDSRRGSNDGER